jgi:hypothetical protein
MKIDDNRLPKAPGEFAWQINAPSRHLAMMLPCGDFANLPVNTPNGWTWDGNEDAPTLTPSILCRRHVAGSECGWHGYMTKGELRRC